MISFLYGTIENCFRKYENMYIFNRKIIQDISEYTQVTLVYEEPFPVKLAKEF